MSKYRLPDIREPFHESGSQEKKTNAAVGWSAADFENWLQTSQLASWTRQWIESLKITYGEKRPELMFKGLGGSSGIPSWMRTGSPDARWLIRYLETSDTASIWFSEGFLQEDPQWLAQLIRCEEAKVARSFLLSGNIADYVFDPVRGYRPAIRVLVDAMMRKKDCVLTYRLSRGLCAHSSNPDMIKRLPKSIQSELGNKGFRPDTPLVSELCHLFDVLNQWLTNEQRTDKGEPGSQDFANGVAIIFENLHLIIPQNTGDIERNYLIDNLLHWSNSPELFRSSHCLILMAEALEDVDNELRARGGKIEQITIPRPENARARLKFLLPILDPQSSMKETRASRVPTGLSGLEGYSGTYIQRVKQLSHDTAGLTLMGIEDLLQEALMGPSKTLSRDTVMNLKRERLRQESDGILEIIDPHYNLDSIGGYSFLKDRLREIIAALRHSENELIRSTVPMGILLVGPPGTGKSIIAEALAGESNISMAKLGDFRGMYVGQSERNLSRIFNLIESLHPVIIFIDEIDQALGKRGATSGDGGVDNRIFGRFLEFMSDTEHRGSVLWIGASNFPNNIDPAMKRAGRFDLVLPVLLPDEESRKAILKVLLQKACHEASGVTQSLSSEDLQRIASLTEGFSGAELRAIVGEVLRRIANTIMYDKSRGDITLPLFEEVLSVYQPPPQQRKQYREMEILAIQDVSFIDMLPPQYQALRQGSNKTQPDQKES